MATAVDIGSLITRTPGILGGRPRLEGTRISVMRIAGWHNLGWSPEEIAANWGYLSLAQVHAALAYYYANREEIDQALEDEHTSYEEEAAAARAAAKV